MRKVVLVMHISLDGMVAGPGGELDWINVSDLEIFPYVARITEQADVNLFGRTTYQMMEGYWPTAGDQPGATEHDISHSRWLNAVEKVVFSTTLSEVTWNNARIVRGDIAGEIVRIREKPGKNLIVIGSTHFAWELIRLNLIDQYWLTVNPVVLGRGIPLFPEIDAKIPLKLVSSKVFDSGVVGLCYEVVRA
jgi:dihydrofolate reductase